MRADESSDIAFIAWNFLDTEGNIFRGGAELHLDSVARVLEERGNRTMIIQRSPVHAILRAESNRIVIGLPGNRLTFYARAQRFAASKTRAIHFNYIQHAFPLLLPGSLPVSGTHHGTAWDIPSAAELPSTYMHPAANNRLIRTAGKMGQAFGDFHAVSRRLRVLAVDTSILRFARLFSPGNVPNTRVIPNFVDTCVFSREGPKAPIPHTLAEKLKIFFPRNLSVARGLAFLPPLLGELRRRGLNPHLFVAGKRASLSPAISQFERDIAKSGLSDCVSVIGSLKSSEMSEWYRTVDVTIIPTLFCEGTSLSCLEAMACGSPVVVTEVGGLLDLIHNGFTGFVAQPTVESIADSIERCWLDESRRKFCVENALRQVEARHSFVTWSSSVSMFFENSLRNVSGEFTSGRG